MKNMLKIMLMLGLILPTSAFAETVLSGNVYVATKSTKESAKPIATTYEWQDTKGNKYPIYLSATGRAFVNKVSGKTGKEYKYYLGEEISRDVCAKLGVEYVEKSK